MLDKDDIMKVAFDAVERYVEGYNRANEAEVYVDLNPDHMDSDHGIIVIDGGYKHGAWVLQLGEL